MLRRNMNIRKQNAGYGAIPDVFCRKSFKNLENFVLDLAHTAPRALRNSLNKFLTRLTACEPSTRTFGRRCPEYVETRYARRRASGYLLRLMTGLVSLSEVMTISRLLMSSAFLSSEIAMPSLASKCWITSSMIASAFSTM